MSAKTKKFWGAVLRWGITVLICIIILFPVYWIFSSSITPYMDIFSSPIHYIPENPTLENYQYLVEKLDLWGKAGTTLILTLSAIVLATVVCLMAAYAIVRLSSKGIAAVFMVLIASALIPPVVTARPLFDLMSKLKLVNTYHGLALLYTSSLIPFTTLIFTNFVGKLPIQIEEAAAVDGANLWQRMTRVTLPLMRPAIATVCIINFISCLNELFIPLFFSLTIEPLSIAITTIPRRSMMDLLPWDLVSAMGVVILLPIILFVVLFEKQIIEGIVAGGVKA